MSYKEGNEQRLFEFHIVLSYFSTFVTLLSVSATSQDPGTPS